MRSSPPSRTTAKSRWKWPSPIATPTSAPPEFAWLVHGGLAKDPAKRYQSVGELCARIQMALEGKAPVQCPCTGLKRANGAWSDFIDAHPVVAIAAAVFGAAFMLAGVVATVYAITT